jgi:RNA polymerase sigma-70 factor (ECF subfamily)
MIHDEIGAEDVLQEVFLAIWKGADKFRGRSSVKTWMYRIAFNQSMSWLRSHRQYASSDMIEDLPMIGVEDDPDIWEKQRMQQALSLLSIKQRAVVELTFVYGMNYREISDTLRIPIGTVKSRMKYALKALAQSLNNMGINRKI